MNGNVFFTLFWLAIISPILANAQGFAELGAPSRGFAMPQPNYQLRFPHDHGSHPKFRIEWWYLTANLQGPDQTDYGLQWTLFRSALSPETASGWHSPQLWMGHAAVTSPEQHFTAERLARGGIGQAGVTADPFAAWIDDWSLYGTSLDRVRVRAAGAAFEYDMELTARGPLVLHGQRGFSVKSNDGAASHYYSQPFYEISGMLTLPQGKVPVKGQAWLDREWSSSPLAASQIGWDWFSLSFENGDKLMAFQLRDRKRSQFNSATWIAADGTTMAYGTGALLATPVRSRTVAGRKIPTVWALQLPDRNLDIRLSAINPNAWMDVSVPYWEGPIRVEGSHSGRGYLEMTGYE